VSKCHPAFSFCLASVVREISLTFSISLTMFQIVMDTVNGVNSAEYDSAENIEVTPTIFPDYDNLDLTVSESNSEMAKMQKHGKQGPVCTTLHFNRNLRMDPIRKCYITLSWKGLPWSNTVAYWAHSKSTKKMKCCEYDSSGPQTLYNLQILTMPRCT